MSHESNPSGRQRLHPLVATAAVSLTVFALAGAAAVTGLIASPLARDTTASTIVDPVKDGVRQPAPVLADASRDDRSGSNRSGTTAAAASAVGGASGSAASGATAHAARPATRPQPPRTTTPAAVVAAPNVTAPAIDPTQATVMAIDRIEEAGDGSGLGVIGGGIVGGALGNQIGGGNGRKAMTVLGAVGGAVAGNALEKKVRSTVHYDVQVRMADGSVRKLRYDDAPPFQPGDRIRVDAHAS